MTKIPVIDLFAGPGGLCEGFSHAIDELCPFQTVLSIEKDKVAHRTLTLRAFVHYYMRNGFELPQEYYEYVNSRINRETLFASCQEAAKEACAVAWCAELGATHPSKAEFDRRIKEALCGERDWVLIGGPPCQAYSLAGRSRSVGMIKNRDNLTREEAIAEFNRDPRQRLYRQYLRIIAVHSPAIFVMENVAGMLSAKVDGKRIFPQIIKDLKAPGDIAKKYFPELKAINEKHNYRIFSFVTGREESYKDGTKFLIRAENYGVPQCRHRVILFGIRDDFYKDGVRIPALAESGKNSVRESIGDLPKMKSAISPKKHSGEIGGWDSFVAGIVQDKLFCELDEDVQAMLVDAAERRKLMFRDGGQQTRWKHNQGQLGSWYDDPRLEVPLNHVARSHMPMDLWRYLFVSAYGAAKKRSPVISDFPIALLPKHANVNLDDDDKPQDFADRFKVQLWDKPSSTVTSHISKDGHYFIHPDTAQCRSLTVREAARLQTFPDNYFFEGNRTQQYHQVGNAVPPYLAYQLATVVWNVYKQLKLGRQKSS